MCTRASCWGIPSSPTSVLSDGSMCFMKAGQCRCSVLQFFPVVVCLPSSISVCSQYVQRGTFSACVIYLLKFLSGIFPRNLGRRWEPEEVNLAMHSWERKERARHESQVRHSDLPVFQSLVSSEWPQLYPWPSWYLSWAKWPLFGIRIGSFFGMLSHLRHSFEACRKILASYNRLLSLEAQVWPPGPYLVVTM